MMAETAFSSGKSPRIQKLTGLSNDEGTAVVEELILVSTRFIIYQILSLTSVTNINVDNWWRAQKIWVKTCNYIGYPKNVGIFVKFTLENVMISWLKRNNVILAVLVYNNLKALLITVLNRTPNPSLTLIYYYYNNFYCFKPKPDLIRPFELTFDKWPNQEPGWVGFHVPFSLEISVCHRMSCRLSPAES